MLGIFLDTETNGLNPYHHRILEIACKIVDLKTGVLKEEYQTLVAPSQEAWTRSDRESLSINGFSWEEVEAGRSPQEVSQEILGLFARWGIMRKKAVFVCQNPSFDRAFFAQLIDPEVQEKLQWPYHWLDLASMHWALAVKQGTWPGDIGLSKDLIAAHYQLPKESKPHRAMNGVEHLLLCYKAIVGFPDA